MQQILYISSCDSKEIHIFKLTSNGKLILIQVVQTKYAIQPIVINPKKRLLYIGTRPNPFILTFFINTNGTIEQIGETLIYYSSSYINIDRLGKYFFSASYNNALFSISTLDQDGIPYAPHRIICELKGCHSVNIHFDNKNIFVPALLNNKIFIYEMCPYGILKIHKQIQLNCFPNSGPRHITFHPNKKIFYSINELNSSVDVWIIKNKKNIIHLQNINIFSHVKHKKKFWASDIHITPNGKYLYTCDRSTHTITTFLINEKGILTFIEEQYTEKQPRGFNIDLEGKYLIVAGQKSGYIKTYKILHNQYGKLYPLERYKVGNNPIWITAYNCT